MTPPPSLKRLRPKRNILAAAAPHVLCVSIRALLMRPPAAPPRRAAIFHVCFSVLIKRCCPAGGQVTPRAAQGDPGAVLLRSGVIQTNSPPSSLLQPDSFISFFLSVPSAEKACFLFDYLKSQ